MLSCNIDLRVMCTYRNKRWMETVIRKLKFIVFRLTFTEFVTPSLRPPFRQGPNQLSRRVIVAG